MTSYTLPYLYSLIAAVSIVTLLVSWRWFLSLFRYGINPIKVGVLHSLTGTMAISEQSVVNATLMAIEEINKSGGVLGRKIKPIVTDGRSIPDYFAQMAEKLIVKDKVSVIFGCWTSGARKTVIPILEKHNHLMFYPLAYEGLESCPNIVYTGATPNQQIIPSIQWAFENLGTRFYLVGSDYIAPHAFNAIIKDQISALGAELVGEEYLHFFSHDVKSIVSNIVKAQPDIIINTLNGAANVEFFKCLRNNGVESDKIPTMSFCMGEVEIQSLEPRYFAGDYAAWSYFQNITNDLNQRFISNYKKKFGKNQVTDDPIEAAYLAVHLWAQAVTKAGSKEIEAIKESIKGQKFRAPEGKVKVDSVNNHTWKTVRIGKIRDDGQFTVVWSSGEPVPPIPYPTYRSKEEWETYLNNLYQKWGNKWINMEKK